MRPLGAASGAGAPRRAWPFARRSFTGGLAEGNSDGFPQIHSTEAAICRRAGISQPKARKESPLLGSAQGRDQCASARAITDRPRIPGATTRLSPPRAYNGGLLRAVGAARRRLSDLQKATQTSARRRSLSFDQTGARSSLQQMQRRPWTFRRGHGRMLAAIAYMEAWRRDINELADVPAIAAEIAERLRQRLELALRAAFELRREAWGGQRRRDALFGVSKAARAYRRR